MSGFRAAAIQMRSGVSVEANTAEAERLIRAAAAAGADYALTPEMTTILCLEKERLLASISTEAEDPSLARFRALARELGIHVHIGSMAVKVGEASVANRSFLIGPDGGVLARYDKIHMFDVDLPNGESYRESRLYRPGDKAVVADLPWLRLGLSICYDLRFPDLYHALATHGAEHRPCRPRPLRPRRPPVPVLRHSRYNSAAGAPECHHGRASGSCPHRA